MRGNSAIRAATCKIVIPEIRALSAELARALSYFSSVLQFKIFSLPSSRAMLALLSLPFICSWFGQVSSSLTPFVLHERRSRSPSGWVLERKHDASAVLPLRFGLTQSNIQNLEEYLYDISDPDSSNFGKHWTPLEVAKTFAPSAESVKVVHEWLIDNGIPKDRLRITPSQGWIEVDATVEEAEHLILADYYVYKHESGQEHIGEYNYTSFVCKRVD